MPLGQPVELGADVEAEKHLALIDSWSMADSGHFFDWQGKEVPW